MSAGLLSSTLFSDIAPAPVYWNEARRPLPTLLFILPLLLAYECGVTWFGAAPGTFRNGADFWMRSWALDAGLAYDWLLPSMLVIGLLLWQIRGGYAWRVSFDTLTGMFGESLLFAAGLVVAGQGLAALFHEHGFQTLAASSERAATPPTARALSFLGAGIYEEMMFRLVLIPVAFYLLRVLLIPRRISLVLAVLISSVSFAGAHYLDPAAGFSPAALTDAIGRVVHDPALWYGFSFRLMAGLMFSLLLLVRGFGVTVGCHAMYDLLAGVLMQSPEGL